MRVPVTNMWMMALGDDWRGVSGGRADSEESDHRG